MGIDDTGGAIDAFICVLSDTDTAIESLPVTQRTGQPVEKSIKMKNTYSIKTVTPFLFYWQV